MELWWNCLVCVLAAGLVRSDYSCVCNYSQSKAVYADKSNSSTPIGYLYEFDCKAAVKRLNDDYWEAIEFEHQVGYIELDATVESQSCNGDVPTEDKLTTSSGPNSSEVTPLPVEITITPEQVTPILSSVFVSTPNPTTTPITTPLPTTVTTTPLPTTRTITGAVSHTPYVAGVSYGCHHFNIHTTNVLFTYMDHCYEVVTHHNTWDHAENDCKQRGGHLVEISNTAEQNAVYTVVQKQAGTHFWIGLHDRNHEEQFEWSTGGPVVYTHWIPARKSFFFHGTEDCVALERAFYHGQWDDHSCTVHYGYICEFGFALSTTAGPIVALHSDGDVTLCTAQVQSLASQHQDTIAQFGNSCYELYQSRLTWPQAESHCTAHGGHLTSINNAQEQGWIEEFMKRHNPLNDVWIGLTDNVAEGQFKWTSGDAVTYTNWSPSQNTIHASKEDCTVLMPFKGGQWDDLECEHVGFFLFGGGQAHYVFCEYEIPAMAVVIG